MSIIQDVDLVAYQLRSNYLNTIKDGVGERLITINDSVLNRPGFKAAGWRTNPQTRLRTHSPPIPTAITSEYFRAPKAAGLPLLNVEEENEENGLVTGGNAESTFGPGLKVKRRRREQMEEDDSSDLSDDSDEDDQRAAQAIKFAKMPVRLRSGSSPMRKEQKQDSNFLTSPQRKPRARRGSQSTVEAIKERARRDTATSSEISSDNDFDNSAFKAKQAQMDAQKDAAKLGQSIAPVARQQSDLLPEEMDDDSDGSYMSSAFAGSIDSQSMLSAMRLSTSTSANIAPSENLSKKPPSSSSPKKSKSAVPNALPALPPPRPISFVLPKSLLSAAIQAKRTKAAQPFEKFATFSGQGDPNPIRLRIWVPFTTKKPAYYEVLIRRLVNDESGDRQVTVADLIGLSLWRYNEEKKEPALTEKQLNVNSWTLRMIEDEEVDFDFPPLDRTKPLLGFCTVNAQAARARRGNKFDEFALVEATPEQFAENKAKTPQFVQESVAVPVEDDIPAAAPKPSSVPALTAPVPPALVHRVNPLLTTVSKPYTLADTPAPTIRDTAARPGVQKLLRIHIHSSDAAPGQMLTIDVTTGTYLAEVLDIVCRKRSLDKAAHVLKLTGSGAVVLLDRTVGSIGQASDLDLWRRRFATDGVAGIAGSPSSPRTPIGTGSFDAPVVGKGKKKSPFSSTLLASAGGVHPLAREQKLDERGSTAGYRKWTVWRKQPMRFVAMNERVVAVDGEYLHIMPGPTSKNGKGKGEGEGKTTTVHFSNVVGCKVVRRHPTNFKVGVWRGSEPKHYEFEAKTVAEAAEIVEEIKKGIAPYSA